jgi:hypothetical protein
MILSVKERGQFVATMRYINVWLMETLAGWVPSTPEMEVKLQFGEHLWDAAQHADAFGKRTSELRMPLQHSLPPVAEYVDFLDSVSDIEQTQQRLAAIYDVLLPGVAMHYRQFLEKTDSLADAPTVRIIERHLSDIDRMLQSNREMCSELPDLALHDQGWIDALKKREAQHDPVAASGGETTARAVGA